MTLATVIAQIAKIERALKKIKNSDYLDCLFIERDSLNAAASYLPPRTDKEVKFLSDLAAEYASFIADEPTCLRDRDDAQNAIERITQNIQAARCYG